MARDIPVGPAARQYIHELWDEITALRRTVERLEAERNQQSTLHADEIELLNEQLTSFREVVRAHTEAARLTGLIHACDRADLEASRKPPE